jgi:hypothetical protein
MSPNNITYAGKQPNFFCRKMCVGSEARFDFLKDLVSSVPGEKKKTLFKSHSMAKIFIVKVAR